MVGLDHHGTAFEEVEVVEADDFSAASAVNFQAFTVAYDMIEAANS
jgi:hypothetical protein